MFAPRLSLREEVSGTAPVPAPVPDPGLPPEAGNITALDAPLSAETHDMYPRDPAATWYAFLLLVGSNFLFIPAIWRALQFRQYLRAFVFTGSMLSSSFYHLCKPENGICVLPYHALGNFDFLFAIMQIVVTALWLVPFDPIYLDPASGKYVGRGVAGARLVRRSLRHVEDLIILSYGFVIAVLLSLGYNSYIAFAVVGGSVAMIVLTAILYNYLRYGIRPQFDWLDLAIALALLTSGSSLFIVQEFLVHDVYWVIHSLWHSLASVGQLYLLESRNWQHRGILDVHPVTLDHIEDAELKHGVYEQPAYRVDYVFARIAERMQHPKQRKFSANRGKYIHHR